MKFAVIGHPVAHSLSPKMHSANFAAIGFDGTYEKFDVAPEDVERFVREKQKEGYAGLNVTVPHKLAVIPLLDHVDESVARYGACNTLKFEKDGTITGYNTDVIGFVDVLRAHGRSLAGKKVFIVGCGGAGGALAGVCCHEKAATLVLADLDAARVKSLAAKLNAIGTGTQVTTLTDKSAWPAAAAQAEIVVNATPLGLHPGEPSALPPEAFHRGQFVLDIVPTATLPPTAAAAKAAGADATDGLEFLVGQGAKSFELWTGVAADRAAMLRSLRAVSPVEDVQPVARGGEDGKMQTCLKSVNSIHKKVQLWEGGPYWADTNIGAEKPEDYGFYFWWGDTVGYKHEGNAWVASDGSSSDFKFDEKHTPTCGKKRSALTSEGWVVGGEERTSLLEKLLEKLFAIRLREDSVLTTKHDAAQVHWGGEWRLPTKQELKDLCNKCDWTWTTMNGVNGYVVRGREKYASASIFLPCAGYGLKALLSHEGSTGAYWASVPHSDFSDSEAWDLGFNSGRHGTSYYFRNYGQSIRPVQGFAK